MSEIKCQTWFEVIYKRCFHHNVSQGDSHTVECPTLYESWS